MGVKLANVTPIRAMDPVTSFERSSSDGIPMQDPAVRLVSMSEMLKSNV